MQERLKRLHEDVYSRKEGTMAIPPQACHIPFVTIGHGEGAQRDAAFTVAAAESLQMAQTVCATNNTTCPNILFLRYMEVDVHEKSQGVLAATVKAEYLCRGP